MNVNKTRIRIFRSSAIVAAIAFAGPVFADQTGSTADPGYRGPQPVQNAPTPQVRVIDKDQARIEQQQRMQMQQAPQPYSQAQPQVGQQPAPTSGRVAGLAFDPNNRGSGPDKSKFNIVSEKEARRQQGQLNRGGGDNASDGTGGSDASGGGR